MNHGIELINVYAGRASLSVRDLFQARGLDIKRFNNLMMAEKSVNLPCEDPVTNAVNAAKPIVESLTPREREQIEFVIVGTESGLDFGKPISTYIHHYLGLSRYCRSFEVKHACYSGTAALQSAIGLISASPIPAVKALVIASDTSGIASQMTYSEPSGGAGAVAMLVSDHPTILELDLGANGYYSYEVMDTCRPRSDIQAGDSDLSLLSYLHCLEQSYQLYQERVMGADIQETFDYFAFHTPFAGMVKGAHRMLLRKFAEAHAGVIEEDFNTRASPSLAYCMRVGNIYSSALYLALCSLIDSGSFDTPKRVGMFSYGSGCASEFFSGVVTRQAQERLAEFRIGEALDSRYALTVEEYDMLGELNKGSMFGIEDNSIEIEQYFAIYEKCFAGRGLLVLDSIRDYHRKYKWS